MADSGRTKKNSAQAQSYQGFSGDGGGGATYEPQVLQWDPDQPEVQSFGVTIQEAADDNSVISVGDDWKSAKEEVKSQLGGIESIVQASAFAAPGDTYGLNNIVGIGIGIKQSAGNLTGDLAVKVFVQEKLPLSKVDSNAVVAESVAGMPTDVEEVGEVRAQSYRGRYPRPVPCGVSCGHFKVTAGTIGALVVLNNGKLCILSNNHVLANENGGAAGNAIIQPGTVDGGILPRDQIGVLEAFVPIAFGTGVNLVDAAVAWVSDKTVAPQHITYRVNPTPLRAAVGMTVIKNGRTTQATTGMVTAILVDGVRVSYGRGVGVFDDQIVIQPVGTGKPFSQGGDSGSLIASAGSKQPVGLLFAGSSSHTFANPIEAVMRQLGIARFL